MKRKCTAKAAVLSAFVLIAGIGFSRAETVNWDSGQQPSLGAFGDMSVSAVDNRGLPPLPEPCFPGRPIPVLLGVTTITGGVDFDPICMNEPGILAVMLKVRKAPVEIFYFSVRFGNGTEEVLHVKEVFTPGSQSRVIDLPGEKRRIVEIRVVARAIGGGIPVLEFIGFRAPY